MGRWVFVLAVLERSKRRQLEGDANGAPNPQPSAHAQKFAGRYLHHSVKGGIGHNLPQEAPQAFAQAILEVGGL